MKRRSVLAVLVLSLVTSCAKPAPVVPDDPGALAARLTSPDATSFLTDISTYGWSDGGDAAGAAFDWIGSDAASPDPAAAERAGQSAHAIATFLGANPEQLTSIRHGLLDIQKAPVGKINPGLVAAYAGTLTPFQAAIVGDTTGIRGFTPLDVDEYSLARNAFAVLFTEHDSGQHFADTAHETMLRMLSDAAKAGCTDPDVAAAQGLLIAQAGALAGVIHAAATKPLTADISVQEFGEVRNQGLATMAAACSHVVGPVPDSLKPYVKNGVIQTPEQAGANPGDPNEDVYHLGLMSYLIGIRKFDWSAFEQRYDLAAQTKTAGGG